MYLKGCCAGCDKSGLGEIDYGALVGGLVTAYTGIPVGAMTGSGSQPNSSTAPGGGGAGQNQNTNTNLATSSSSNIVSPNIFTNVNTQVSPNISPNFNQQASAGGSSGSGSGGGSPFGAVNQGSASTPGFTSAFTPTVIQPASITTTQTPTANVSPTQTGAPTGRTPGIDTPLYGGGGYTDYAMPTDYPINSYQGQNNLLVYGALGLLLYMMTKKTPVTHTHHTKPHYRQFRGR